MGQVVKLAQQGYDVKTAGDENLIYSSQWPLLKIYQAQPFQISDLTQSQVIATHDLGFPPMFWYFTNNTINSWENSGAQVGDNRSEFFGSVGNGVISISGTQLVYTSGGLVTGSLSGYYYLFANDLTKQFTAPVNNVGGTPAGTNPKRTFKIAKPDKSVQSSDLKDFIIHSDTRSPLIHSINPGTVSNNLFTVPHDLGYNPMFFGYAVSRTVDPAPTGNYFNLYTGSGGSTLFTSDTAKVQFSESSSRSLTIVILKDPFLIDYSVNVTI